jgi:voltage-gated potassium channel
MRTIDENSSFRLAWDIFIFLLIIVSCLLIPFQLSFRHVAVPLGSGLVYFIDVVFGVDILLNFFTTFRRHGEKITDPGQTARHYLKTLFFVDLVANVPLDAFFLVGDDVRVAGVSLVLILRQLRLLRVVRFFIVFRRWQRLSWTNSGYLRIAKYFTIFMLLVHWIACAWFLVPYLEGFPENCWVVQQGIEHANPITQYIRALYWVIQTMATVGYGDITPHRDFEYVFSILTMLMGASTYAFIIGNIASLASNLDASRASFFNRIEAVSQYLHSRQVPTHLNEQVRNYYEYLWAHHRGVKEEALFEDLPPSFRLNLLLHLTRDLLEKVPLFKYCSPVLRNILLMSMKPQTYAPGVLIAREGEIGKEIYFLSHGQVEIVSEDGNENYGTLEDGDYFGDLSLILKERRTASVRAFTLLLRVVANSGCSVPSAFS